MHDEYVIHLGFEGVARRVWLPYAITTRSFVCLTTDRCLLSTPRLAVLAVWRDVECRSIKKPFHGA